MREFLREQLTCELKEIMILKESLDLVSEDLSYHINNDLGICNTVFRYGSEKHLNLINEVRELYKKDKIVLCEDDEEIINSDAGERVLYEGEIVSLDLPFEEYEMLNEGRDAVCATCGEHGYDDDLDGPCTNCGDDNWSNDYEGLGGEFDTIYEAKRKKGKSKKNPPLNKPKRGGSKKFYVYVKDPKTKNIKKVSFGAKSGGGKLSVKLKDPEAKRRFKERHNCEQKNDKTTPGYWSCRLPRYAKSLGLSGGGTWW